LVKRSDVATPSETPSVTPCSMFLAKTWLKPPCFYPAQFHALQRHTQHMTHLKGWTLPVPPSHPPEDPSESGTPPLPDRDATANSAHVESLLNRVHSPEHAAFHNATTTTTSTATDEDGLLLVVHKPLLALFTTQFSASGTEDPEKAAIQRNTLLAFKFLGPEVDGIVFTDDAGTALVAQEVGVKHSADFTKNPHGTPVLKGMYQGAERVSPGAEFLAYCNGDLLFGPDLLLTVHAIKALVDAGTLPPRILIVGVRINVDVRFPGDALRSQATAEGDILGMAARGTPFQPNAEDYFIVRRGTYNWSTFPDFVIGRRGYDNALVDKAHHEGMAAVDASDTIRAVHQTGRDGNHAGHKVRADSEWNMAINPNPDHGNTFQARYATRRSLDILKGGAIEVVDRVTGGTL
jgi:hypothetical protein